MTAILRNESKQLQRSSVILLGVFAVLSALYFSMFPSISEDAEALMEAFPEAMLDFIGIDALHTIEGFIAAELYAFFWVVLLPIYFAYVGAGTIAGDIENRKMDLTLSNPVSRESVLIQKVTALFVPLTVLNVGVPIIVYFSAVFIGESISPVALVMVHLLSVPYLLVCAAIGVTLSVVIVRVRSAQAVGLGGVFILWLIDSASRLDPDYEWIGYFTPSRYYEPTDILVHEEYAFFDAAVLLVAFVLLLLLAAGIFVERDI